MKVVLRTAAACLLLSAFIGLPSIQVKAQTQLEEYSPAECCFVHPNYNGVCVVQPADDENCASILDYLNTPNSAGKTYCSNSLIRGGWEQISCEPEGSEY